MDTQIPPIDETTEMRYILNTTRFSPADVWQVPADRVDAFLKNPEMQALSDEQIAFHLRCKKENYKPTKQEVLDAKKREPYVPPVVPLEDYKKIKLQELDNLSLETAGALSPAYQRQNAEVSIGLLSLKPSAETVYDAEKSLTILENANRVAVMCRAESLRIAGLIQQAETNEEVDTAYNSNQYPTFR